MVTVYGVKGPEGKMVPVTALNGNKAMLAAAKHVHGRASEAAVGKLALAGYKVVEVVIVERSQMGESAKTVGVQV
jgi:hypothetical protein